MITESRIWINIGASDQRRNADIRTKIKGKWLVFGETAELNLFRDLINTLVEEGDLRAAKIARKDPEHDPFPYKDCVLYVFTSDDGDEKQRTFERLRQIVLEPASWKSEQDTARDWQPDGKLRQERVVAKKRKLLQATTSTDQPQPPARIFVSHSSKDRESANTTVDALEQAGFRVGLRRETFRPAAIMTKRSYPPSNPDWRCCLSCRRAQANHAMSNGNWNWQAKKVAA